MLNKFDAEKGVILLGCSSDIGLEILRQLKPAPGCHLFLLGRDPHAKLDISWPHGKVTRITCDLENSRNSNKALSRLREIGKFDLAIIAAGYLPKEFQDSNLLDVQKTLRINGEGVILFLSALAQELSHQNGGRILLLSSVAVIRPRVRNFTYGASKSAADFFAIGLASKYQNSNVKIKIIRPGFVFTKMTKNFQPAPFAMKTHEVSRIAIKALNSKNSVVYAPRALKVIMSFLRILPRKFFDAL